jgi:hypothetical protein
MTSVCPSIQDLPMTIHLLFSWFAFLSTERHFPTGRCTTAVHCKNILLKCNRFFLLLASLPDATALLISASICMFRMPPLRSSVFVREPGLGDELLPLFLCIIILMYRSHFAVSSIRVFVHYPRLRIIHLLSRLDSNTYCAMRSSTLRASLYILTQ